LRVLRDNFAYKEYGIRLMLAPRSAKALQEKVLLKLYGIRKLPGSLSFGGTLLWIIAELSLLRKAHSHAHYELAVVDYDHGIFEAFPSYEAKHQLEIRFHVKRKHGFLQGVGRKELGERIGE
ncbi:hypothetical protein Tco_1299496, partial [Tanacetum coccineum]